MPPLQSSVAQSCISIRTWARYKVSFAEYSFDTSLLIAGGGLLGLLSGLLLLDHAYGLLRRLVSLSGSKRKHRLAVRARNALAQGTIELAEGRFDRAEKIQLQNVSHNDNAMLAYLSAARCQASGRT